MDLITIVGEKLRYLLIIPRYGMVPAPASMEPTSNFRKQPFALIEVVLGIVIAGMGILALIPVMYVVVAPGQKTMVDTRISLMEKKFAHYLEEELKRDWDTYADAIDDNAADPETDTDFGDSISDELTGFSADNTDQPNLEESETPISNNVPTEYYGLNIISNNEDLGQYTVVEHSFEAGIRAEQELLQVGMLNSEGIETTISVDRKIAMVVNLEISWPTSDSYALQRRWYHRYVVLNH